MNVILAYFEDMVNIPDGLEKVVCDFANEFTRRGHRVTVVTFDRRQGKPAYPLLDSVAVMNLQKKERLQLTAMEKITRECYRLLGRAAVRTWKAGYKRKYGVTDFNRVVEELRPDAIVSFETMTSAEICRQNIRVPLITSLQNEPHICCEHLPKKELQAMEKSSAVHVLMRSFVDMMKKFIENPSIVYIPNAIPQCEKTAKLEGEKTVFRVVEAARLNKKQKRQEILVEAFARLADKYPQWILELYGGDNSGYKRELQGMIQKLHMEDRIFLRGVTHHVDEVYAQSDIFAFPSKYEGFGLSLCEAMSAGLPVVGFRSCAAVNELIQHGKNGLLAEDGVDAFAEALEELMADQEKRVRMGREAHRTMEAYSPEAVWTQWEHLLEKVIWEYGESKRAAQR